MTQIPLRLEIMIIGYNCPLKNYSLLKKLLAKKKISRKKNQYS